jgi:hypothetical protein
MSTVGHMEVVKSKIISIIEDADSSLIPITSPSEWHHVVGNWRLKNWELQESRLPLVTVRLGTGRFTDVAYGRKITSTTHGLYVVYPFSAHVFAINADDPDLKAKNAMDLADAVIEYLENYGGDSTSGILYFYEMTARESEVEGGPTRFSRIIIEGFISCKRPLS